MVTRGNGSEQFFLEGHSLIDTGIKNHDFTENLTRTGEGRHWAAEELGVHTYMTTEELRFPGYSWELHLPHPSKPSFL